MSDFHVTLLTEWPVKFSPGQWLDTFIPDIPKAGGFTITSTPSEAKPTNNSPAYLELAVQKSSNPPAQWLWRPQDEILGQKLAVRVGGSFTWPPTHLNFPEIDRLVLIAGGVGIKYVRVRVLLNATSLICMKPIDLDLLPFGQVSLPTP